MSLGAWLHGLGRALAVMAIISKASICLAEVSTEVIGPAILVHVRRPDLPVDADLAKWLRSQPVDERTMAGVTKRYAWAPAVLALAFDNAERGMGGLDEVVGDGPVTIILYAAALPMIYIKADDNRSMIVMTTAFVDLVEGISGAVLIDALRGSRHPQKVDGLGLSAWLMLLEDWDPESKAVVPWPAAGALSEEQAMLQRTMAAAVYQFVFSHELAHITLKLPSSSTDAMGVEMRCDKAALEGEFTFLEREKVAKEAVLLIPMMVVEFMVGQHLYQRAKDTELLDLAGIMSGGSFETAFPAADWTSRARQSVDVWKSLRPGGDSGELTPAETSFAELAERVIGQIQTGDAFEGAIGGLDFRKQVHVLLAAGRSGFKALRGEEYEKYNETRRFELTETLPLSDVSEVRVGPHESPVMARIILATHRSREEAETHFKQVVQAMRLSLPTSWDFAPTDAHPPVVLTRYQSETIDGETSAIVDLAKIDDDYEVGVLFIAAGSLK